MTEKSKLKCLLTPDSNESSDGEEASGTDVLGLSLDKLDLGPKKKLLVLCLGGLLAQRVHIRDRATVRGLRPDVTYGKFLVFKRPFCTEFLNFCFQRFEVAIWSSAREHNIDGVLYNITGGAESKFLFVWSQEDCTDSKFYCLENEEKPLFLKNLKNIWEKSSYKEKYSPKNTLMIDNEPHTGLLNPPNTVIFPEAYKKHDTKDTFLGREGELRKWLDGLADADEVPAYVKEHPFGQPAITPSHAKWSFYSRVVRSFDKKVEVVGSSSTK